MTVFDAVFLGGGICHFADSTCEMPYHCSWIDEKAEVAVTTSAEEIALEKTKIEIEIKRLDLAEEIQKREMALKEKQHSRRSLTAAQATVAGAIIALLSGWIGASITSSSSESISKTNAANALEIERTKVQGNFDLELSKQTSAENLARLEFETSLILGAIGNSSREEAIRNLRFFLAAGFISDPGGKISKLEDDEFPSKVGPSPEDIVKAFEATVQIQFLSPDKDTGYCTAVAVDSKHLLTAGYCDSNRVGNQSPSSAQYSDDKGLHNLSLVAKAAEGGISLLNLDSPIEFSTAIDWSLVRAPKLGEPIYMATWIPSTNTLGLRSCTVIELGSKEQSFSHDCTTGAGSAGSLILSAIDDAPLGIHNGVLFESTTGNAGKAFAAQLTSILPEISDLIEGVDTR